MTLSYDPLINRDLRSERTRAAEARHGGRALTSQLAEFASYSTARQGKSAQYLMAQAIDENGVDEFWHYFLDPSVASSKAEEPMARRQAWQRIAQTGANGYDASARPMFGTEAEAMFGWPIYRAAFAPCTVCGFVGGPDHGAYGYDVEAHSYDPEPVYMAHLINENGATL